MGTVCYAERDGATIVVITALAGQSEDLGPSKLPQLEVEKSNKCIPDALLCAQHNVEITPAEHVEDVIRNALVHMAIGTATAQDFGDLVLVPKILATAPRVQIPLGALKLASV